jgi:hypothetical protein
MVAETARLLGYAVHFTDDSNSDAPLDVTSATGDVDEQHIESLLTHTITRASSELATLLAQHSAVTTQFAPQLAAALAQKRERELSEHQAKLAEITQQRDAETTAWRAVEAPAIRTELATLSVASFTLQGDLTKATANAEELKTEVEAGEQEEQRLASRSQTPSGVGRLPLPCLRRVLSFLTRSDLATAARASYGFKKLFDRGALWSILAVDLVKSVIRGQRLTAQAADAKRRLLGGLTQDFHSSNFLAACARSQLPGPNGQVATAPLDLTPASSTQITISVPARTDGGGKKSSAPPGKADLFARALQLLQKQVDPALSDFEDLSLKLSSHQRIIQFLELQTQEQRHALGIARIKVAQEHHALRMKSQEKDELARKIHALEKEIAREKGVQATIAAESAASLRQMKAQSNLRRNVDSLIAAHPEAAADGADAAADGPARDPAAEAAAMSDQISTLKQQKKVLVKAARSMQAEIEQTRAERLELGAKLEQLKAKLEVFNV